MRAYRKAHPQHWISKPAAGAWLAAAAAAATHPLTFLRIALITSFTPRFICFRLAAFFASLSTCGGEEGTERSGAAQRVSGGGGGRGGRGIGLRTPRRAGLHHSCASCCSVQAPSSRCEPGRVHASRMHLFGELLVSHGLRYRCHRRLPRHCWDICCCRWLCFCCRRLFLLLLLLVLLFLLLWLGAHAVCCQGRLLAAVGGRGAGTCFWAKRVVLSS